MWQFGTKRCTIVDVERSRDKAAKRGRRTYLVKWADGTTERLSRASFADATRINGR